LFYFFPAGCVFKLPGFFMLKSGPSGILIPIIFICNYIRTLEIGVLVLFAKICAIRGLFFMMGLPQAFTR